MRQRGGRRRGGWGVTIQVEKDGKTTPARKKASYIGRGASSERARSSERSSERCSEKLNPPPPLNPPLDPYPFAHTLELTPFIHTRNPALQEPSRAQPAPAESAPSPDPLPSDFGDI